LHPPLGIPLVISRQVRPRPFDVGTLDPNLRLAELRKLPSKLEDADIGVVFDHVRPDTGVGQDGADEVRFEVAHRDIRGERIAEGHSVFLPGGSQSTLTLARPTCSSSS